MYCCNCGGNKSRRCYKGIGKIPVKQRKKVTEITLDMAGNMELIAKRCFPLEVRVTDRFHVQQLATEALQEIRIKHRWEAIDAENEGIFKSFSPSFAAEIRSTFSTNTFLSPLKTFHHFMKLFSIVN